MYLLSFLKVLGYTAAVILSIGYLTIIWVIIESHFELRALKKKVAQIKKDEEERKKENMAWVDSVVNHASGIGIVVILIIVLLAGCNSAKHYQRIHGLNTSGVYTVKTVDNKTVTFKEVAGRYHVQSDTLKAGDQITINVVRTSKK